MVKWFWTILSFGAPALWNLTLAKKLLINDKLTTSCQTTMPSKQYIKRCKQLWKTVRLISFQNPELQSVSIFLNFVHPSLLLHLPCYLYLLLMFWGVIFNVSLNLVAFLTVWIFINFVLQLLSGSFKPLLTKD